MSGTSINGFYSANGTFTSVPNDLTSATISAVVPDGQGGCTTIPGTGSSNGVFTIPS